MAHLDPPTAWPQVRRSVLRDALGVGLATGAYAISFGAVAVASGLSPLQAQSLSALMFTGASQFALVGVLGAGGGAVAAIATAWLLGARNGLYGLHLAPLLGIRGLGRLVGAQLTIDESTAMAVGHEDDPSGPRAARLAFWATGLSVFLLWNLGTLVGTLGAAALGDPRDLGLDAAIPAAFLALLWPRLRDREAWAVAGLGALVAVLLTPVLRPGLPVLAAALVAVLAGLRGAGPGTGGLRSRGHPRPEPSTPATTAAPPPATAAEPASRTQPPPQEPPPHGHLPPTGGGPSPDAADADHAGPGGTG